MIVIYFSLFALSALYYTTSKSNVISKHYVGNDVKETGVP
jgi:hypothetical protein